jgi:hypothetical protein
MDHYGARVTLYQQIENKGSLKENTPNQPYLRAQRYSSPTNFLVPKYFHGNGFCNSSSEKHLKNAKNADL